MKTIVVPDLHHKVAWVANFLKSQEPYDEVVFVGDYFDDFNDTTYIAKGTAYWLQESLRDKKRKHCIGNHDVPYILDYVNPVYNCPGFTKEKKNAINSVMMKKDWDKLVPAIYTQGWLISHAGFTYPLVEHPVLGVAAPEELVKQSIEGWKRARAGEWDKFFVAGSRMGQPFVPGITWADWDELIPIVGTSQIVGHSPSNQVRHRRVTKTQTDWCVDSCRRACIVINDGKVGIVDVI
jgi:hypothetical protein